MYVTKPYYNIFIEIFFFIAYNSYYNVKISYKIIILLILINTDVGIKE